MPKFAANLNFLFTEVDFMQRFAAARAAGFRGVEFPVPYDHDRDAHVAAARGAGVEVVLINSPVGNFAKGERGLACDPDRVSDFRAGIGEAIGYARALGCKRINCLAGIVPRGADPRRVRATLVENLRFAAGALADAGILLVTEPLSTHPGFALTTTAQALDLLREVGVANLKIQYDLFHMQAMEGNLARTIEAELPRIGHMQFADVPDRHEPGTGELNFDFLFGWIDRVGYDGWVSAEYHPARGTAASLGWLKPYL